MKANVINQTAAKGTEINGDITKVYTFRKLNSTDVFLMFKILGKIGIRDFAKSFDNDTVKELIKSTKGAENATTMVGISVVLEIANTIVGNLPKCETEIYEMLSSTSNLSVKQVKELDFVTFTEMVIDFIKKEEFKDFFKVVLRLFKPGN